jgi:hypothetical protein
MKKLKKNRVCMTNCMYQPQYLPNGGVQWLLPKPWTFSIGQCMRYCTGAPPQPSKWPANLVHFFVIILLAVALAATQAIQVISRRMAASSGVWVSPGHATSSNAICIAPAHPQGLQNGLRQRYILMSSLILPSTITLSK